MERLYWASLSLWSTISPDSFLRSWQHPQLVFTQLIIPAQACFALIPVLFHSAFSQTISSRSSFKNTELKLVVQLICSSPSSMSFSNIKYSGLRDRDQAESDPKQIPVESFWKYIYSLTENKWQIFGYSSWTKFCAILLQLKPQMKFMKQMQLVWKHLT